MKQASAAVEFAYRKRGNLSGDILIAVIIIFVLFVLWNGLKLSLVAPFVNVDLALFVDPSRKVFSQLNGLLMFPNGIRCVLFIVAGSFGLF